MIAGHAARGRARDASCASKPGAKRAVPLPVSAPFHCALMQPAQDRMAADLARAPFRDPAAPLVSTTWMRAIVRSAADVP